MMTTINKYVVGSDEKKKGKQKYNKKIHNNNKNDEKSHNDNKNGSIIIKESLLDYFNLNVTYEFFFSFIILL